MSHALGLWIVKICSMLRRHARDEEIKKKDQGDPYCDKQDVRPGPDHPRRWLEIKFGSLWQ